ncbi:transaldolase family protein [Rubrobacter indicoceani]|uniref:transaldolase family protein n=1 Tax=Rubrobacter indicoceani TaxID=2051957 RepID=UPI000E5A1FC8|nr:transaldolase family protein [Rubrobacter indicoceani]
MTHIASTTIGTLAGGQKGLRTVTGDEKYLDRVRGHALGLEDLITLRGLATSVGVTGRFKEIVDYFGTPEGETPAGFRVEKVLADDGALSFDLVRDIGYDKNGQKRPTGLVFSVDSANPYEIEPAAGLIGNLTCNPGIVYDLFLNNPEANVGNKFGTLEEVLEEIGRIVGPGTDVSVELNNPFEEDFGKILEQIHVYEEILSKHRLVVKVPHTGPVNPQNVRQLLEGDGRLDVRYDQGTTADYLRGHNLALKLHEHGYRVNFTLMFAPHQAALALQARPYFINAFLRNRITATRTFRGLFAAYESSEDIGFIKQLRDFMVANDYLAAGESNMDLLEVVERAKVIMHNRRHDTEGADGLDSARHALRWLRTTNLSDTRLILCSMQGPLNYPDIMRMLTEEEFIGMHDRVVITTEPNYLARWTSHPQVVSYQRRFMRAARAVNEGEANSPLEEKLQEGAPS